MPVYTSGGLVPLVFTSSLDGIIFLCAWFNPVMFCTVNKLYRLVVWQQ